MEFELLFSSMVGKKNKKLELKNGIHPNEVLATKGMLHEVRAELKSDIVSSEFKIELHLKAIEALIKKMDEQDSRNKLVFESYPVLFDRQDRLERQIEEINK